MKEKCADGHAWVMRKFCARCGTSPYDTRPPILFNPYTGARRDPRDIETDPQGILIVAPGDHLYAAR